MSDERFAFRAFDVLTDAGVRRPRCFVDKDGQPKNCCSNCHKCVFHTDRVADYDRIVPRRLRVCPICSVMRYCSRICQVQHWPKHKTACRDLYRAGVAVRDSLLAGGPRNLQAIRTALWRVLAEGSTEAYLSIACRGWRKPISTNTPAPSTYYYYAPAVSSSSDPQNATQLPTLELLTLDPSAGGWGERNN